MSGDSAAICSWACSNTRSTTISLVISGANSFCTAIITQPPAATTPSFSGRSCPTHSNRAQPPGRPFFTFLLGSVTRWAQISAAPTAVFKEFELSCLPEAERTAVFHSSGTTAQRPSRHFHNAASLAIYRTSLWPWFCAHVVPDLQWSVPNCQGKGSSGSQADKLARGDWQLAVLTPPRLPTLPIPR